MTITHSVPSTTRQPGQFHEFDLTSSAAGLVPLGSRILGIGVQGSGATATADDANQIFDELQSDLLLGQGSESALMARKALETGKRIGFQPEIWMAGIADPAGTAALQTLTAVGNATGDGDIVFRIAGRTLRAGVSNGDTVTTIALAIKAAIDAQLNNLPVTAAAVIGVVTCTANDTGINGEDIFYSVDDVGNTGTVVTAASTVPGVGVATPATALANSLAKYYEVTVLANHGVADITTLQTHLDAGWAPAAKRWTFSMMAETGTLATANTLSTTSDDERMVTIAYEASPSLPGEIGMAVAVAVGARALANFNWDGDELPLFLPTDANVFTDIEIESALAAGSTPLAPNDQRTQSTIVRLITTKTTEGGSPFENAKDLATMRGLVFTTRQLDARMSLKFSAVNKSAQVLKRIRSESYEVLKALEAQGVVQNVDALFGELKVETDPNVATRAVVSVPESIIPNLHQIVMKHVLFVE